MTSEAQAAARGWTALRDGRWAEARRSFEVAAAVDASPEILEGLSWAAWWQDDSEKVFEAREAAFRAYREQGKNAAAARMAIWLGADQLDFNGALATASGWLDRAARLLEGEREGADHGWLEFHQGFIASIKGQVDEAEDRGASAARIGRATGVADLEMLGLGLEGLSKVSRVAVESGMRCLDEASALALSGQASIPISGAWTCCFMVTACTRVLDFNRAFEWCDRIAEFADRYGSRYMLGFCRAEYATIHLWRGDWQRAERALEESIQAFRESRPGMVGGPLTSLAELRRRQGRADEALELLEQAGSSTKVQLCQARMALDRGDGLTALELAERLHRNCSPNRPLDLAPILEVLVSAHLACGASEAAEKVKEHLADVVERVKSDGFRARLSLIDGQLAVARGDHDAARTHFEDALDGFDRCGARFDAACARVELATALDALGRGDDASRERARSERELKELGAALGTTRGRSSSEPGKDGRDVASGISKRETEVLALLTEGLTNREIAERLFISEHTVHRHVTSILRKLDVPSRTAAAALALRDGLLPGK